MQTEKFLVMYGYDGSSFHIMLVKYFLIRKDYVKYFLSTVLKS